ncbi:hypothetical protein D3C77_250000 [compost metagenome]
MEVAEIEEVHVRRRVEATQRPIQIDGCGLEINRHTLGRHYLHTVASKDVLLDGIDRTLVVTLGETGTEGRFSRLRATQFQAAARSDWLTQLLKQPFKTGQTVFVGVFLGWIGQDNGVHLAREVVEYHHGIGNHQQNIRYTQWIGIRALAQTLLHITHAVIAEVAHQATVEPWQTGDGRHLVALFEGLNKGQRVFYIVALDLNAVVTDPHLMVIHTQHGAARQANNRIAPPLLAALHRLEQVGIGLVGQFQVDRQRRVEVSQGLAGQGNAVVAFSGQAQEFFAGHDSLVASSKWVKQANGPATAGSEQSGAPTPTGQGLDDFHPEFAGNRHDGISI